MRKHDAAREVARGVIDLGRNTGLDIALSSLTTKVRNPTRDLLASYLRACRSTCGSGLAKEPESPIEHDSIDQLKNTFRKSVSYDLENLIRTGRFEQAHVDNSVRPTRRFIHSEHILYHAAHTPAEVTFLAEMNNKSHEWVNLSPFGWIKHSQGPVFTQVIAPLQEPFRYRVNLLYSQAAFMEELEAIKRTPMQFVLGIAGRSFIVESALQHIAQRTQLNCMPHSSVSALSVNHVAKTTVEITASLSCVGKSKVSLSLSPRTATISISEHLDQCNIA
jgi:hypothetical protein